MRSFLSFVVALLVVVGPTAAAEIDTAASRIYVFVDKTGRGHAHAVEGKLSGGELHLDRTEKAGVLKFDMRSFAADTTAARRAIGMADEIDAGTQASVTTDMHGSAVLNIAKHPSAEFVVNSVKPVPKANNSTAGESYELAGELTLRGVKQPLTITAVAEGADGGTRLRGQFVLKQTDYGITPLKKLLGLVGVKNELTVHGDIRLRK
jgi:polyisoprenoid-binding protein YceI